jgi:hypothetical protein
MKVETGKAVLKVDDFGNKYWDVCDSAQESSRLDNGRHLKFNPESFKQGTEIKIFEKTNT